MQKNARSTTSRDRPVSTQAGAAGQGTAELQQLLIDLRDASAEVRALAQALRERPSSLLREAPERGVEIAP